MTEVQYGIRGNTSKPTRNLLIAASLATALGASGCAYNKHPETGRGLQTETSYARASETYKTPESISGHELRQTTEKDRQYSLEGIVVGDQIYFASRNTYPEANELDFSLIKQNEARRVFKNNEKTMQIQTDRMYILEQVLNSQGNPAHEAKFTNSGNYAIKADMTNYKLNGVGLGIVRQTQEDAKFKIKTANINGREWYLPLAPVNDTETNKTPFFVIPFANTDMTVNPDGTIQLTSHNGIWRGREITSTEYNSRFERQKEKDKQDSIQKTNPGQLELVDIK